MKILSKDLVEAFHASGMTVDELATLAQLSVKNVKQQINGWKYGHPKVIRILEVLRTQVPGMQGAPTQPPPPHCVPKSYPEADVVPPPPPATISEALPGSLEKIEILRQRVQRQEHLWHAGDHGYDGEPLGRI
jgi:hypothetical protein